MDLKEEILVRYFLPYLWLYKYKIFILYMNYKNIFSLIKNKIYLYYI